jgi:thiol-disulfide isomerase/thioredoxin
MRSLFHVSFMTAVMCLVFGCEDNSRKTKSAPPASPEKSASLPEVGRPAPEIEGEDLDGKTFKLSDYKGKVVLLDFWAMWCPPCRNFLPHGKQMVEEYQGRPFAALGVNNDDDLAAPRSSKVLAMRCWADGRGGPITRRWGIEAFPTLYVIDHEGIVRKEFVGVPDHSELDNLIARLVRKAEGKS